MLSLNRQLVNQKKRNMFFSNRTQRNGSFISPEYRKVRNQSVFVVRICVLFAGDSYGISYEWKMNI